MQMGSKVAKYIIQRWVYVCTVSAGDGARLPHAFMLTRLIHILNQSATWSSYKKSVQEMMVRKGGGIGKGTAELP